MQCSIHVASVVHMSHMLMCHGGVMKSQALSMRQQMATYFSALVHDFEHGGVNNDFLVLHNYDCLSACLAAFALVHRMHSACVVVSHTCLTLEQPDSISLLTTKLKASSCNDKGVRPFTSVTRLV